MKTESYRLNLEYRTLVDDELRRSAERLLGDEIGVIAASRIMSSIKHEVATVWPELGEVLVTFVAIDSETDALPIGAVRAMWHPSTAALEDQKISDAEERFRESARDACHRILKLLDGDVETHGVHPCSETRLFR